MKKLFVLFLAGIFFQTACFAETVVYNQKTGIYHNNACSSAAKCKTCIKIEKKTAQQKGARACKKCGG